MQTLVARIDGRGAFPVSSWEQVSTAYRKTIEALDLGSSRAPRCTIHDGSGRIVAHVSYNGRVWEGQPSDWMTTKRPLYDPGG